MSEVKRNRGISREIAFNTGHICCVHASLWNKTTKKYQKINPGKSPSMQDTYVLYMSLWTYKTEKQISKTGLDLRTHQLHPPFQIPYIHPPSKSSAPTLAHNPILNLPYPQHKSEAQLRPKTYHNTIWPNTYPTITQQSLSNPKKTVTLTINPHHNTNKYWSSTHR